MNRILDGFNPYIVLFLMCLVLYASGIASVPPMDRDEARFAQASKQMIETGDYIRIKYQNVPRHKKPAGIYWLQAGSARIFGKDKIWAYRIPSVAGGLLSVLMTMYFGSMLFDRKKGLFGALLLGSSVLLTAESHLAKTDAFLLACTIAAQGTLALCYTGRNSLKNALFFWIAIGIGILIKGPIVPLICLLTALTLSIADKKGKWLLGLKPAFGIFIAAAIALPWFLAVSKATGGAFASDAIGKDLLPKLLKGQESHGAYPGYYLLLVSLTLWPGSLFMWPSLFASIKEKAAPAVRFCLAWLIPSWILFEIVPTKLPHYVMPMYPAIALLTANALFSENLSDFFKHKAAKSFYVFWAFICVALGAGIVYLPFKHGSGHFDIFTVIPAFILAFGAFFCLKNMFCGKKETEKTVFAVFLISFLTLTPVFCVIMPSLNDLWLSRRAVKEINAIDENRKHPIASVGYHEPSLVFLAGTDTKLINTKEAKKYILENRGAIALVADKHLEEFLALKTPEKPEKLGEIKGFNYSRGKKITLSIFRAAK